MVRADPLPFRFAAGTLTGASHLRAGRNNQDALALRQGGGAFAAVVCDGCGSGERSELGAQLGADLLAAMLERRAGTEDLEGAVHDALEELLACLEALARPLGAGRAAWVEERLLFTVVAAFGNARRTLVLGLGDGVVGVNGRLRTLGPFPDNAPPYLGYSLLGLDTRSPGHLEVLETERVHSLLLGTDGVAGLADAAALPDEPGLFLNRDALRRRLWRARQSGGLEDDATVVLARRFGEA